MLLLNPCSHTGTVQLVEMTTPQGDQSYYAYCAVCGDPVPFLPILDIDEVRYKFAPGIAEVLSAAAQLMHNFHTLYPPIKIPK
jgi:hypothetical protein